MKKLLPIIILAGIVIFFFKSFLINLMVPIPSDNLVGLYHPFRDFYAASYPRGIPYKNFLISDPIEQQYPWRYLSIELFKNFQLPLWNSYSFAGTPLLANQQSAPLYPLNIIFFLFPFAIGWSFLILLQPLLGGLFMYVYLRKIKLSLLPGFIGAVVFTFSGFSMVWMQWNTIVQTVIWLPLILLMKEILLEKFSFKWAVGLLIAECFAFFAGHLQTWFYVICIGNAYLFFRIFETCKQNFPKESLITAVIKKYYHFLLIGLVFLAIISIQLIPTFIFISLSARNIDLMNWQTPGWFIPWEHALGLIAPDFFGNPATLNYWGVWNYMEFAMYAGIVPFILALYSILFIKNTKIAFFWALLVIALLFALPTPIAKIPYILQIPFLSTSQPTRLTFVIDFSLSILAAFGLEKFLMGKRTICIPVFITSLIFACCWIFILFHQKLLSISSENILVAKRNLIFPTSILFISALFFLLTLLPQIKKIKLSNTLFAMLLIAITVIDLIRYGQKFTPFTSVKYLYPQTQAINFLQSNQHEFRYMATDRQILPPNSSIMYHLQTVSGYDPLYLRRYGEFIAAMERNKPDINPPFGFNRIITPQNYKSPLINLLGVKYVLSLINLQSKNLKEVFKEGETHIYENTSVLPRAFSVGLILPEKTRQDAIEELFSNTDYEKTAVVENFSFGKETFVKSDVKMLSYEANKVTLLVNGKSQSFVILTDVNYPTWTVAIDGTKSIIYQTDYLFRGIIVPAGMHTIVFSNGLL